MKTSYIHILPLRAFADKFHAEGSDAACSTMAHISGTIDARYKRKEHFDRYWDEMDDDCDLLLYNLGCPMSSDAHSNDGRMLFDRSGGLII